MRPFAYVAPKSIADAQALLQPGTRPLAGGTDLLTLMKADLERPERLVAMRTILPRGIDAGAGTTTIGAATSLAQIERDDHVRAQYGALAQACRLAASAQLRNMATLGGNLLQRPRCWYYRNPLVHCWLKGGDACHAREGENQRHAIFGDSPCVAVHPSDPAAALIAFDAHVRVVGAGGERMIALEHLLALPEPHRRRETILGDDEILLDVAMPAHPPETRSVYLKAMDRAAFSFALAGVAIVLRRSAEGRIGHARVVLSGVAPIPWRCEAAEQVLLGAHPDDLLLTRAADAAVERAHPLAKNAWKRPLARALVKRALETLCRD